MPNIIKDGAVVEDGWQVVRDNDAALPEGQVIVSVERWQRDRDALLTRGEIGVWLGADQSPKLIADDLANFAVVAVDFPKFMDGRGFSYGRELREQHGYQGEVRAIGDIIRDQLFFLKRCGFNSFELISDKLEDAVASLSDFSETYQAAQDQPLPLFRRR